LLPDLKMKIAELPPVGSGRENADSGYEELECKRELSRITIYCPMKATATTAAASARATGPDFPGFRQLTFKAV
jgi:hypothetical protein